MIEFNTAKLISPAMRDLDWMVEMQIVAEERKPVMTREDLLLLHANLCEEAKDLMKQKNEDYAIASDVFRNFRMFGLLGVLVRMSDKIARLRTYAERGKFTIANEKVRDDLRDLINYSVLFEGLDQETRNAVP